MKIRSAALFLFITQFIAIRSYTQKYQFEMFLMGSKVADVTAEKKVKGDVEMYNITTIGDAKILWKSIKSHTTTSLLFKAGVLTDAYFEHKENGEVEKFCKTVVSANKYSVQHWKKNKYDYAKNISKAIACLYFQEPVGGQEYYDEYSGAAVTVKKLSEHTYEYKSEGGDKSTFIYTNGKLAEAEFHTSIVNVKMKPKA